MKGAKKKKKNRGARARWIFATLFLWRTRKYLRIGDAYLIGCFSRSVIRFRSITCKHQRENILSACLLPMILLASIPRSFLPLLFHCHLFRVVEQIILPRRESLFLLLSSRLPCLGFHWTFKLPLCIPNCSVPTTLFLRNFLRRHAERGR